MLTTITQKILMRRKLKMEVEREKIFLEKTWLVLIQFSVTRHFQLCVKNYCFLAIVFHLFFFFETFYFPVFIQWELNWSSKWFVTFALSVLWCWSYLIYKSLKSQFSNQTTLIIFWKFRNFKLIKYSRVKF